MYMYGGNHGTGTSYCWLYTDDYISLYFWFFLAPGRDSHKVDASSKLFRAFLQLGSLRAG